MFFWVTEERLDGFLNAKPYRNRVHDVLSVDTAELLRRHWHRVTVSSINTGSAHNRRRRSLETFQPVAGYQRADVVELAVERHVPEIAEFTLSIEEAGRKRPSRGALPLTEAVSTGSSLFPAVLGAEGTGEVGGGNPSAWYATRLDKIENLRSGLQAGSLGTVMRPCCRRRCRADWPRWVRRSGCALVPPTCPSLRGGE